MTVWEKCKKNINKFCEVIFKLRQTGILNQIGQPVLKSGDKIRRQLNDDLDSDDEIGFH